MTALLLLLQVAAAAAPLKRSPRDTAFAHAVATLSEPGGFFWSDNLVSNETSYLHVVPRLLDLSVRGGAYIGVGPEQNFSYIARTRPTVALIIDIRRDNLLLHLFLKAIFERADTRLEYLCLLYARPCPTDLRPWRNRSLDDLMAWIDAAPADSGYRQRTEDELFDRIQTFGVPVSLTEFGTLRRLHDEFVQQGLELRFSAYGRRAVASFPTVRQLYSETDLNGRRQGFLADEDGFLVVQRLERADKIIPVVGDLAGVHAVKAIGRWLLERGDRLSLFYLSNVEFYLHRQGTFGQFVANVRALPTDKRSHLVRSYFGVQTGMIHPAQQPNHLSVQLLQAVDRFLALIAASPEASYWQLMTEGMEPLEVDPR